MAISNLSTGLRPGVCTSTTRPSTPFEGQMIYETDTNRVLVYEGAAWVMIADTDTPPALELVKVQTVGSAVASVTVSDCFSSTYDNYRLIVQGVVCSQAANITFQFSGITSNTYLMGGTFFTYASATASGYGPSATNVWAAFGYAGTTNSHICADIFAPFASTTKAMFTQASSTTNYYSFGGTCTSTTSATGFVLGLSAGTMTGGTIRVYGYRNTI